MKYCSRCGQALIPNDPPRYDMETGEKLNERCPSGICEHQGVWHRWVGGGFWKRGKCEKCGEREYDYGW